MPRELKIMNICFSLMLITTLSLAADFGTNSATLKHNYFPMEHGDKLIYRSYGFSNIIEVYVEALAVEVIDSVECLKIYSSAIYTYFWMAEGITGNIWLLKEFDSEFNETTFYGKENAKLIYPKNLLVGATLWKNVPEHIQQTVIATGVTVPILSTGLGPYYNCVKTVEDWGDGDLDYHYYAPNVGNVKVEFNDDGGINGLELKEIDFGVTEFTADPLFGNAPLKVNFTDQSNGVISNWFWDFGDGSTSSEQNPSHTYTNPGTYTVSLTVDGPGGSDEKTKVDFITVSLGTRKAMPFIPLLLLDD
jgi:hypothetical protein